MTLTQARLKELLSYDPATGYFRWNVHRGGTATLGSRAGSTHTSGYRVIVVDGKSYKEHRLAFLYMVGQFPQHDVDHINHQRADNRWGNLRELTRHQNLGNLPVRSKNRSGYTGVEKRGNSYRVRIGAGRDRQYVGSFPTPEQASAAYQKVAESYYNLKGT